MNLARGSVAVAVTAVVLVVLVRLATVLLEDLPRFERIVLDGAGAPLLVVDSEHLVLLQLALRLPLHTINQSIKHQIIK